MKSRKVLFATFFTLCCGAASAEQPLTIFGIPFNEPLSVPECPWKDVRDYSSRDRNATERKYDNTSFSSELCYTQHASIGGPPKDGLLTFVFPLRESPSLGSLSGRLVDGRVARLEIRTRGIQLQESDFAALTEKFGQPTSTSRPKVQNRMGAAFETIQATWKLPNDVTVIYSSTLTQLDDGIVMISTPEGDAAQQEAQEEFQRRWGGRDL